MKQQILFASDRCRELDEWVDSQERRYDRFFILVDKTTAQCCLPLWKGCRVVESATPIVIEATDLHKNVESLMAVWTGLVDGGASRRSLLVNLGGGMVTDLGGFAASTFKRGLDFVNVPTTLLAMVDASVGGKTGINFRGLKNEIGVFNDSKLVLVDTGFLRSLDAPNLLSGYAEMLKHALLKDENMWTEHLCFDWSTPDFAKLQDLVAQSVAVKEEIVTIDPHEKGIRKALNLGHTAGHALESLALSLEQPVLHGYAVAWGLIVELYLSVVLQGFPSRKMRQTVNFVREHYGSFGFNCSHYEQLYTYMLHDKKNTDGRINFTLLHDLGEVCLDCHADKKLLFEAFDFLREG